VPLARASDNAVWVSSGSIDLNGPFDTAGRGLTLDNRGLGVAQVEGAICGTGGLAETGKAMLAGTGTHRKRSRPLAIWEVVEDWARILADRATAAFVPWPRIRLSGGDGGRGGAGRVFAKTTRPLG
jgi:hypothetical protein